MSAKDYCPISLKGYCQISAKGLLPDEREGLLPEKLEGLLSDKRERVGPNTLPVCHGGRPDEVFREKNERRVGVPVGLVGRGSRLSLVYDAEGSRDRGGVPRTLL